MKYAILTDIHSNIFALKAVMQEIDSQGFDKIICLGDIVGNGVYPEETVSYIKKRGDFIAVKGNHELFITSDLTKLNNGDTRIKIFRWQQRVLSKSSKEYLKKLPEKVIIEDAGKKIVCFHYPKNNKGRFKDLIYLPNEEQLKSLFFGLDGDIFLFGHEHSGSLDKIDGKYYLNFGTLGNFLEENTARYGVMEVDKSGVKYELRRVYYDDEKARTKQAEINGLLFSK